MNCKDFHHLPRSAAGQPLKSAEPSNLVITQTTSRKAVAIRRNILTPRDELEFRVFERDKTFLSAKPLRKVSWTKRCVAGGRAWRVELGERPRKSRLRELCGYVEYEFSLEARSILEAASSLI